MSTYNTTCPNCGTKLVVDDGDCYAGGIRDNESIFCPNCNKELDSVYTSGKPYVYYASTDTKK